jgi:hypothetical protein
VDICLYDFTGVKSDFKRRVASGDYCEVRVPSTDNTMKERTASGIALLPTGNANGSVHFFLLKTRRVVVRDKFIVIQRIPEAITAMINDIARGETSNVTGSNINSSAIDGPAVAQEGAGGIYEEAARVAANDDIPINDPPNPSPTSSDT